MNLKIKRALMLVCVLAMLLTIAAPALAADDASITVASVETNVGTETALVDVTLTLAGNTGILGCYLAVNYDAALTPKAITRGEALGSLDFTPPAQFNPEIETTEPVSSPMYLVWDGENTVDESNGVLATITFEVPITEAKTFAVSVAKPDDGAVFTLGENNAFPDVPVDLVAGGITVKEASAPTHTPGDINGDGSVNGKDVTRLLKHLAGGFDVTVVEAALDVNGDGTVNGKDVTRLLKYLAGGFGVEIH